MTKLEGALGLARRGGFVTFGLDLMFKLSKNRVKLVIFASDIGFRSRRDINMIVGNTKVIETTYSKEELGLLIGAQPVNAIGITDSGLARKIVETIGKEGDADVKIQKEEQ